MATLRKAYHVNVFRSVTQIKAPIVTVNALL